MYAKIKLLDGTYQEGMILRTSDNTYIPFVESNIDYQDYLKWLAEGNTPADEPQGE